MKSTSDIHSAKSRREIILKIVDNHILCIYSHLHRIHDFLLDGYIFYILRVLHSFNHIFLALIKIYLKRREGDKIKQNQIRHQEEELDDIASMLYKHCFAIFYSFSACFIFMCYYADILLYRDSRLDILVVQF